MTELAPDTELTVVGVAGELCRDSQAVLAGRLEAALALGQPVLVDLSDCTFLDISALRMLDDSYRRACELGIAFALLLPFEAEPLVRRLLLELAPSLTSFPVVPSSSKAGAALARTGTTSDAFKSRWETIRATIWETCARSAELQVERDQLLFALRASRSERRATP